MSSGYFPLGMHDPGAEKLREAARLIREVRDEYSSPVAELGQAEDAASDGGELALLWLAANLADGCVERIRGVPATKIGDAARAAIGEVERGASGGEAGQRFVEAVRDLPPVSGAATTDATTEQREAVEEALGSLLCIDEHINDRVAAARALAKAFGLPLRCCDVHQERVEATWHDGEGAAICDEHYSCLGAEDREGWERIAAGGEDR